MAQGPGTRFSTCTPLFHDTLLQLMLAVGAHGCVILSAPIAAGYTLSGHYRRIVIRLLMHGRPPDEPNPIDISRAPVFT